MQHSDSSCFRAPGLESLITIVHDASAWPAPVLSFSKALLGTVEKHDNATPASHRLSHDTARNENQLCPASMPALAPDFQGLSIAMLVEDVLSQTVPELTFHYNATYAIAVYPCCSTMMPAPVMPARGLATMFATKPIDLAQDPFDLDATNSADTAQAHLLLPQYRNGSVPLALLCVASHDEIYSAMSSALLQRRALGIITPLLGLAFNDSVVHLVLGWYTASQGHRACCDIHLAHGAVKHTANHGLGRFDISSADSTHALVQALLRLSSQLCSGVTDARLRSYSPQETMLGDLVAWRADVKVCEIPIDMQARVMQWLSGIEASTSGDIDVESVLCCFGSYPCTEHHHPSQLPIPAPGVNPIDALNALLLQKRNAYPMNKDWEDGSFLAESRQMRSPNAAEIEILAENQVQPCAWPAPDFPDDHFAVDALALVHRDVLSCVDFSDRGGGVPAFLNDINRTEWDQYKEEVALEARMRKDCNLPGLLKAARRAQDDMIKILPLIFRLSEDALAVGHTSGARMPWERLLAACLHRESSSHIRHEWRVSHPRNIFFDRVHDFSGSASAIGDRREALIDRCRALSDGLISLGWIYPDSNLSAEETSVPEWLHTTKSTLSEALQGETIQRIKILDAWATRLTAGHTEVDLRVLNAQTSDICDVVAYLSIPVPDLTLIGDRQWRQWDDFCIIGQCSSKRQYSSSISVDDTTAQHPQNGGDFVVTDPVLREVRRMGTTADLPVGVPELLPTHPRASCEEKGVDNPKASGKYVDVPLPYLWLEDNTYPSDLSQTFNRARSRLLSTIRFYLALGIEDVVIFALVTVGSCAHLLCGWGINPSEEDLMNDEDGEDEIIIVDNNCPVWDLRDKSQAVRFCAFLLQLRQTHLPKLRQAFEARKEEFTRAWTADPTAARFQWTMKHQQSSPLACDLRAERKRQLEASVPICSAMETIERGLTHAEVRVVVRKDTTAPAYLAELDDSFARTAARALEPDPRLVELRHKACTQLSESCSCPFHRLGEVPVDIVDNDV
ncbi:hypothetical protein K523DRAFT_372665 [Schizophyllum commune Tattone D]|nr:hypothetical protein K523DRAFT_372665 [Schizophyllum commune Tattone D]